MAIDPANFPSGALEQVRGVAHEWYHRLAALNYDRRFHSRNNSTPAGTIRCYEPITRHANDAMLSELDAVCGPTDVIVDVGAHVGIYALALATDEPDRRVAAFEPPSAVADRFRANLALNGLGGRIDLHACALGERDGRRTFYRSSNPELSAFDRAAATRWGATVLDVRSVPVRRLDSLVTGLEPSGADAPALDSLASPDVIKVDVEGAAPSVLRGARAVLETDEPTVFVERHDDGLGGNAPAETTEVMLDLSYDMRSRTGYWRFEPR
ncbi:FkbM family methyltransferase [Salinadaptatus halalkaliphilus]|uniref:FkbM family methyltransferase n=1 Tax=Salinadaptatus halalkaliphilus TaxID=2419781 RepID=A0A4S3TNB8_9EURY|nr:FkbM family methyltransferase [Salinadaptatus halalkaliphilus]THE65676.1 FkbM family methyltransferase [Salinadaptatus halalkaliphilus]